MHELDPAVAYVPLLHVVHTVLLLDPITPEYVPAGHCVHAPLPSCSVYAPAGHALHVHVAEEEGDDVYSPAMHAGHVCVPVPRSMGALWLLLVGAVLPIPSCPYVFRPQHLEVPSSSTTHVVW